MSGSLPQTAAAQVAEEFNRAIESHQKGKLDRAKRGYKRVLTRAPNHADALHLLGVIDLQRGNNERAADLISQALAINPQMGPAHYNLARCLKATGDNENALTSVTHAVELMPDDVDAALLQGNLLSDLDRKEEAVTAYSRVLDTQPTLDVVRRARAHLYFDIGDTDLAMVKAYLGENAAQPHAALRDMAIMRIHQEDKDSALSLLEKSLELEPDDRQTQSLYAGTLIDSDRNNDALPVLRKLLREDPDDAESKLKLGILFTNQKRFKEALPVLEGLHQEYPEEPRALLKLAYTYQALERFDEAIAHYEQLKILMPDEARSWSNMSAIYLELEDFDRALEEGMEALRINPNVEQSYLNIAVLLQKIGDYDRAIDLYRRALLVNPEYATAGSNLSHLLLACGEIEDGWDLYGHGFNAGLRKPMRHPNVDLWRGEQIPDDTILVWKEQGVGDDIRFASCFPDIIRTAGKVIIETDPRLVDLYQRSFPEALVRDERTKDELQRIGAPEFKYHTPAGQLPVYFRRSLADFPAEDGYLKPDPERVAYWREKVEACGDGIRLGLSWRSMNQTVSRNLVYSKLTDWADLIGTAGITCINLQYDDATAEIAELQETTGLTLHNFDEINLKDELDDAAALTKACDLVVSAGTSVSDMAAAVGTPVLFYGDTRHAMQLGTDRFPWYPSARFFGRERKQPIEEVVAEITSAVQDFTKRYLAGELD